MSVSIAAQEEMPPLAELYSRHALCSCKFGRNPAVGCLVTFLVDFFMYVSPFHLVVIERRLQQPAGCGAA